MYYILQYTYMVSASNRVYRVKLIFIGPKELR